MDDELLHKILSTQQFWVAAASLGAVAWGIWYTRRRDGWKGRVLEAQQVQELLAAGEDPLILDTRRPAHVKREPQTIAGALHLPLEQIPARLREKSNHRMFQELRSSEIIVVDTSMDRATLAAQLLKSNGMTNVILMRGGLKAWRKAGLPTQPLELEEEA